MDQREIDAIAATLRRLKTDLGKMPISPAAAPEDPATTEAPPKRLPSRSKPAGLKK